jgi:hypothetical protein
MFSGHTVTVGLVVTQCIAAAVVMHDRVGDALTAIWSLL